MFIETDTPGEYVKFTANVRRDWPESLDLTTFRAQTAAAVLAKLIGREDQARKGGLVATAYGANLSSLARMSVHASDALIEALVLSPRFK